MAALHLVFRSPAESPALERCLARAGEGDAVLLLEDGVYAASGDSVPGEILRDAGRQVAVYALMPDLDARGLEISALSPNIQPVDYPGFVALTTAHNPIVSWT